MPNLEDGTCGAVVFLALLRPSASLPPPPSDSMLLGLDHDSCQVFLYTLPAVRF